MDGHPGDKPRPLYLHAGRRIYSPGAGRTHRPGPLWDQPGRSRARRLQASCGRSCWLRLPGPAFMEYLPLWINLAAAVGTLYLYTRILRIALAELPDLHARAATAWMAVFLISATNLIGLAFTGMEHSLQVFLCALIVLGMLQVVRGLQPPAWLVIAIIVAPIRALRVPDRLRDCPGAAAVLPALESRRVWRAGHAHPAGGLCLVPACPRAGLAADFRNRQGCHRQFPAHP